MVKARVLIQVLARVVTHVLAHVVTHVLARAIMHVHDYYLKTCVQEGILFECYFFNTRSRRVDKAVSDFETSRSV